MSFLIYHTQNVVEKIVLDPFIENQISAYLWINSLKIFKFIFIVCPSRGLPKYTKIKVLTTCFYLKLNFFKKQKELWS